MEIIFGYIKNIVYFSIFINLILNVFPDKKYTKYIKVFAGFLLILVVLEPFSKFGKINLRLENLLKKYSAVSKDNEITDSIKELETSIIERVIEKESGYGEN